MADDLEQVRGVGARLGASAGAPEVVNRHDSHVNEWVDWPVDAGTLGDSRRENAVRSYFAAVRSLLRDDDGAALIEYTVLTGILVLAVLAAIIGVGGWVSRQWTTFNGLLS